VGDNPQVPLYLTEADVAELLTPAEAVEAIESCFRRMAAGSVENRPRYRLGLESGALAVMAASDLELGFAGAKVYAGFSEGARFVVLLFRADAPELVAVIDADKLGQLRTGAASGVAARHLAKSGARSLGLIGCGWQAESQLAAIRVAVPELERVVAYCRTKEDLSAFCEANGAEPGESHQDPAECDVVVTVTSSRDPVLRGEWLQPGALVCAVGANDGRRRELDNVVLERAAFVSCDSLDDAKLESADLIEPVESGVLDWLEVHELQEVVAEEVAGRQSDQDIVVFKSNGLAAWDVAVAAAVVERARAAGAGVEVS
jgi:alanine dehydrogenase